MNSHPRLPDARVQNVFQLFGSPEARTPEGIEKVRQAVAEAEASISEEVEALEGWLMLLDSIKESIGGTSPRQRVSPPQETARANAMRSPRTLEIAAEMAASKGVAYTPEIAAVLRREGDTANKLETAIGNVLSHHGWKREGTGVYRPPTPRTMPTTNEEYAQAS